MVQELKIYDVGSPKIRLGNEWDGGYVIPELILKNSQALFTYGVGDDTSFEIDYIKKTNNQVFLYDHLIEKIYLKLDFLQTIRKNTVKFDFLQLINFKSEGLWYEPKENCNSFFKHYEESKIVGKVLLKMDIEGDELPFFLNTDIERLSQVVSGIVVEFHPIDNPDKINDFFKALEKINKYFYHCHFHPNNYGGKSKYVSNELSFELPHIIEMTFVNKKLVLSNNNGDEPNLDMSDCPTSVDRKNDLNRPDISIEFLKQINNLKKIETKKNKEQIKLINNNSNNMIYISLTTVPLRLNLWDTIKQNLDSLLNQATDKDYKVLLNIPLFYKNNDNEEYVISSELLEYASQNPKLIINRVAKDYGPVVKITGALQYTNNLNDIVIICDDDHIYHQDMLEYHMKKLNEYPDSIICFRGDDWVDKRYWIEDGLLKYCLYPSHYFFPVKNDAQLIRPGHWHSAGYRRSYFGDDFLDETFLSMATNDDVLSGYYFKLKQIDYICVSYDRETDFRAVNSNGRPAYTFPIVKPLPFPSSGFDEFRKQCGHHMGEMDGTIKNEFHNNHDKIFTKILPKQKTEELKNETFQEIVESVENIFDYGLSPERRVVVSFTTIPERLRAEHESGIKSNIKSLLQQDYNGNYEVHINIPKINKVTQEEYVVPEWMKQLAIENTKFKIFDGLEDLGPITKLIPTLKRINEPDTIIIICDDDLIYHPKMILEQVKNQLTYKDTACGYDGGLAKRNEFGDTRNHFVVSVPRDIEVRILQHYKTVSYQRYFFKDDIYEDFLDISWNDDISVSAYVGKYGFTKLVRNYPHEEQFYTEEDWRARGGVTTFPVLSHTSHEGNEGCWHFRSKGVKDNHEKYVSLGWL